MQDFSEDHFRKQAEADGVTHISTGIAIVRDGKILAVRRATHDYLGGQYELPGGGVDPGETLFEAAIRETQEETGLIVSNMLVVFAGFDYETNTKPHVRQLNFLVHVAPGEVVLNPDEHDGCCWIDAATIDSAPASENMRKCFKVAITLANQH